MPTSSMMTSQSTQKLKVEKVECGLVLHPGTKWLVRGLVRGWTRRCKIQPRHKVAVFVRPMEAQVVHRQNAGKPLIFMTCFKLFNVDLLTLGVSLKLKQMARHHT